MDYIVFFRQTCGYRTVAFSTEFRTSRLYGGPEFMPINRIRPTLLSASLFATLSACSAPEPEAVSGTEANYNMELNIAQLMSLVLSLPQTCSGILEAGYSTPPVMKSYIRPQTMAGCTAQAAIVVEAGNMLALPGRAEDDDAWMIYSEGLSARHHGNGGRRGARQRSLFPGRRAASQRSYGVPSVLQSRYSQPFRQFSRLNHAALCTVTKSLCPGRCYGLDDTHWPNPYPGVRAHDRRF